MQVGQIRQEYNLFWDFSESTTQYILLRFFTSLYIPAILSPAAIQIHTMVSGEAKGENRSLFWQKRENWHRCSWRMGNLLKPGTHLGCHGNRRPSLSGHISALKCNRNTVSVSKTMFYGVRILFLIWKIASRRRPSWISRWPPCEIMFFRMTLVLNNLAKQCWCLYEHFQGPGIHLWHLQCH